MPPPKVFPCGGPGQPACAPTTSISTDGSPFQYTLEDMQRYGLECYQKGHADAVEPIARYQQYKGHVGGQ
jgi:hypothetical protein